MSRSVVVGPPISTARYASSTGERSEMWYERPEVWLSRSRIVIGRPAGAGGEGVAAVAVDAQSLPRREIAVHRIGEREDAALVEHHERHGGDRLGHRVDAEDRVGPHRLAPLAVHDAERREPGDLAAPRDEGQRAGDLAGLDVARDQVVIDAAESFARQADALGGNDAHARVSPRAAGCQAR